MAELKMTKNELRSEQNRLNQLQKYLPTLLLKKALLQAEVAEAKLEFYTLQEQHELEFRSLEEFASLFTLNIPCDLARFTNVTDVQKRYENIAGAEVPYFESCSFEPITYDLFETPVWLEAIIAALRTLERIKAQMSVAKEKLTIVEKELREVSIRVNLFEKILIPRAERNIKKIKVFLGDLQLAAVSQAKVAKTKIIERKEEHQRLEKEYAH